MLAGMTRARRARSRHAARKAADSPVMAALARAGLAARGVLYIVIGIIAVQVAMGSSRQQADRTGAVRLVAATPFGSFLLWLLAIGFTGMALWQLCAAIWGSPGRDGRKPSRRLGALVKAVFYAVVAGSIFKYALGLGAPPSSDKQSQDLTARLTAGIFLIVAAVDASPQQAKGVDSALRALARIPLGPWLLVAVAVGLAVFGLYSLCEARWRAVRP